MATVVITGASGFIAKHIVAQALDRGHFVRATVRSDQAAREVQAALAAAGRPDSGPDRLAFFTVDLLGDAGWDAALTGADALIHTASPFPSVQPRDPDDLARPAVEGTLRALRAARAAGVHRVVLTSSIAAVIYAPLPSGRTVYDERDWSDPDGPLCNAYSRSKTLAERAAWQFTQTEAQGMALTAINPGFVLGPGMDARLGTSLSTVRRILRGSDPMVPKIGFPCVDVRDVARLHLDALERPETAGSRFLASGGYMTFPEMALVLKAAYPDRRVVTRRAPDWLVRMLAWFDRSITTILPDLGRTAFVSAEKAATAFGIEFRPPRDALLASARMLIETGAVQDRKKPAG